MTTISTVSAGAVIDPAWGNSIATVLNAMNPTAWNVTSITQNVSVACTTTSGTGWYQQIQGTFTAMAELAITGTGTASNNIVIPTPLTLTNLRNIHGWYQLFDASDAFRVWSGVVQANATTSFCLSPSLDAGNAGGAALGALQFTAALANLDVIRFGIVGRYA